MCIIFETNGGSHGLWQRRTFVAARRATSYHPYPRAFYESLAFESSDHRAEEVNSAPSHAGGSLRPFGFKFPLSAYQALGGSWLPKPQS
jgi:hypothetical protein